MIQTVSYWKRDDQRHIFKSYTPATTFTIWPLLQILRTSLDSQVPGWAGKIHTSLGLSHFALPGSEDLFSR